MKRVFRKSATALVQPKISSTRFRIRWLLEACYIEGFRRPLSVSRSSSRRLAAPPFACQVEIGNRSPARFIFSGKPRISAVFLGEVGMSVYKGKCFCGAVEIMVDGDPVGAGYCHCASCRS